MTLLMKTTLAFIFASSLWAHSAPVEIALQPNKEGNREYGEQLIAKFNALLESNKELKAAFAKFE